MRLLVVLMCWAVCALGNAADKVAYLDEFNVAGFTQGWAAPQRNLSVNKTPMMIAGKPYARGVGTHSESSARFVLDGKVKTFRAMVGKDDSILPNQTKLIFMVYANGKEVWTTGEIRGETAVQCEVPLDGVKHLELMVLTSDDGNSHDHANWCDAAFVYAGKKPTIAITPAEKPYILTPPAPKSPLLNNAPTYGTRPGNPMLYRIPCTGERPLKFTVTGLPDGLTFDPKTATIAGTPSADTPTTATVKIAAANRFGRDATELQIVIGPTIALTPPMGWNSWNCFAENVSDEKVRAAAKAMVTSGLADYGYDYVNIDDYWENCIDTARDPILWGPARDEHGFIVTNKRFPNMKNLFDFIHSLGLKGGIYSGPGPTTCGSCIASFDHEYLDAQKYGEWGVDYLKYDWCSYRPEHETSRTRTVKWDETTLAAAAATKATAEREDAVRPFALMGHALAGINRNIVYSLCQYGMEQVWTWGPLVGGNSWRTTGDIDDTWSNLRTIWLWQVDRHPYAAPGHWNDPDMLVVGALGWGKVRPCKLTPSEQYTHYSAWAMLNSPLLLGCDLTQLDAFTRNILMNREIIAVNQDALGRQARRTIAEPTFEIWQKEMADGSTVIGIFNLANEYEPFKRDITFAWSDLGIAPPARIRDLWRNADVATTARATYTARAIPRHGVTVLRTWEKQ